MSGTKITKRTDPTIIKLADAGDILILTAKYNAQQASKINMMRYVRNELCRMEEAAKNPAYQDKKYIANCESIKQRLAGSDEKFKADGKIIVDCLVVDAALQCRIEKGPENVNPLAIARYFKSAYSKLYGNQK